jgi:hypothetical protein
MKTALIIIFLAIVTPLLSTVIVNVLSPEPSSAYSPIKCTRYCHNHFCKHKPAHSVFDKLYTSTIPTLKNNHLGLSYKEMNILVFVILWPATIVFLLIMVLLNHFILRKIKGKLQTTVKL